MKPIPLLLGLVAAWLLWSWLDQRGAVRELQGDGSFSYPGYAVQALESFEISGRVLSTKGYRTGREAQLSPLDIALGWGPMAEAATLSELDISQRNRWVYWRAQRLPISRRQIETHMANIHIIPANAQVAEQLNLVDAGSRITLKGELVQVNADDGWRWRSSLSRTDTGAGSCEVLWLTSLRVLGS